MKWFAADLHLGHKNIIDYCDRPFRAADGQMDTMEMKHALIENFRSVIRPGDELYVLGDLSFDLDEAVSFLQWVPGQKFMIWGNHDPKRGKDRQRLAEEFVKTGDILETSLQDGTKIVMCHYPMLRWNRGHFGSWMLHGHTHGECTYPDSELRILDVGVDVGGHDNLSGVQHRSYFPWSEDEISRYMAKRRVFEHHYHPSGRDE